MHLDYTKPSIKHAMNFRPKNNFYSQRKPVDKSSYVISHDAKANFVCLTVCDVLYLVPQPMLWNTSGYLTPQAVCTKEMVHRGKKGERFQWTCGRSRIDFKMSHLVRGTTKSYITHPSTQLDINLRSGQSQDFICLSIHVL